MASRLIRVLWKGAISFGLIPERFLAKSGPKSRIGKIFVDYLRNGFGATTTAA